MADDFAAATVAIIQDEADPNIGMPRIETLQGLAREKGCEVHWASRLMADGQTPESAVADLTAQLPARFSGRALVVGTLGPVWGDRAGTNFALLVIADCDDTAVLS